MGGRDNKTGDEELAIAARVDDLIERGLRYYARGDVQAAIADWEHALALDPDSEQARQHLDEHSRNFETFDQTPAEAEDTGVAAGDDLDVSNMDTIEGGWLSSDQPLVLDSSRQSRPEQEQMMPGNLRAVAEELLGIAHDDEPRAAADWSAAPTDAAESSGEAWDREPANDPRSAALAPTLELVFPERLGDLFETGDDMGADSDTAAGEDSSPLPPPDIPPVVIEELGDDSDAYATYPGAPDAGVSTSPDVFEDGPTVERGLPEADAHEASRTKPLELPLSSPSHAPASTSLSSMAQRLLDELEAHAPADQDSDESLRQRLLWLIDRAESECVAGDDDAAITALDLALDEQPDSAVAQKLIHHHLDTILDIYERYLDNPAAVPTLQISPSEFREHAIDNRAAFLLSRIDGTLTLEDILDISGMPRLETCRYLCGMLHRGILTLR